MTDFTGLLAVPALNQLPRGQAILRVLAAALQAVEPGAAVQRFMQRTGYSLFVDGREYDLRRFRRVWLVGAGKAGAPMARAAAAILGDHLTQGIVIVKEGHVGPKDDGLAPGLQILQAGHPVPDERGVQGAQHIANLLRNAGPDNLVICLISGGGSALLASPVTRVTLADLQSLTAALLACGADINEINTLRKHLEQLKGGQLARLAAPAALAALVLSDVIGDPLDVIASGPTAPDLSNFDDAVQILQRYHLVDQTPPAIVEHLQRGQRGELPDTPKPGDPLFANVQNVIVGSNFQAAQAGLVQAQTEGFNTLLLTTALQGEARYAGRFLAAIARQVATSGQPLPRPVCIVVGGETTVTLKGDGLGGRNQEMALAAVSDLAGLSDVLLVTLATDGGDGPTDAAGAVVTSQTLALARQAGLRPADFLERNDAYHFFDALGALLKPGPTQTNVNDLAFLFAW